MQVVCTCLVVFKAESRQLKLWHMLFAMQSETMKLVPRTGQAVEAAEGGIIEAVRKEPWVPEAQRLAAPTDMASSRP